MRVALVGSPNSGKTSLFNWITGSRFKTVNYAGATVESHLGLSLPVYGERFEVIDTPGVYSLHPGSRDEEVTLEQLNRSDLDRVVLILDASQLRRQLLLAFQMQEMGVPFSIALTMGDLMHRAPKESLQTQALSEIFECPVMSVDGRLGGGIKELVSEGVRLGPVYHPPLKELPQDEESLRKFSEKSRVLADRMALSQMKKNWNWDRWFIHSSLSFPIFALVMTALFTSVFFLATPLMDLVDLFFVTLSEVVASGLGEGLFSRFLTSGMIEGVGAVLVFVPQIFILFLGLGLLEESGYLARAATLIDRPLHLVGLSGRSFVPLLSGFACAVPAVMATRNIKSQRERWIAVFILPFMTCSARLPVYALLLAFLFFGEPAWKPGLAMAGLYFGSALIGGLAAWILHKILRTNEKSYFMMELPPYRRPRIGKIINDAFRRTRSYVRKAGPTILVLVLVLWVATHLPYDSTWNEAEQLQNSVLAQVGEFLEPLFLPMGLDWRVGVALLSAFVAREVFVSALAVIFNLGGSEASVQDSLIEQMKLAHFPNGSLIFTGPAILAMIVYFMLALQCLSTTGVTVKEMGSWKYGLVQLVSLNVLAYALAVLTFQVFS